MNVYDLFPSPYVRAGDLPAKGIVVTIKNVIIEDLRNAQTKKIERKPVMYFQGAKKGMVLNKTNGFIIAGLYGPDMDNWPGQRIELYPTKVDAFGKMQDAIRVRERRYELKPGKPIEQAPVLESPDEFLDHELDDDDVDGDFRAVDASTGEILQPTVQTQRSGPPVQPEEHFGDNGNGDPDAPTDAEHVVISEWRGPLDAQAWAIAEGYCDNDPHARNAWIAVVKACGGFDPKKNAQQVYLTFLRDRMSKVA